MKTAIILHGQPSKQGYYKLERHSQSNSHWLPWLQHQLTIRDILAQTPEMPVPYEPVYEDWKAMLERFDINEDTLLVGQSAGAAFIVRYLSENKDVKVGKVVLVAPWMDPNKTIKSGMLDFELDPEFTKRTEDTTIFMSTDDEEEVLQTVSTLREACPDIKYREFEGYGHFVESHMKSREFPELLEELVG